MHYFAFLSVRLQPSRSVKRSPDPPWPDSAPCWPVCLYLFALADCETAISAEIFQAEDVFAGCGHWRTFDRHRTVSVFCLTLELILNPTRPRPLDLSYPDVCACVCVCCDVNTVLTNVMLPILLLLFDPKLYFFHFFIPTSFPTHMSTRAVPILYFALPTWHRYFTLEYQLRRYQFNIRTQRARHTFIT